MGHGVDVASQRLDDLDREALGRIKRHVCDNGTSDVGDYGCGRGGFAMAAAGVGAKVHAVDIADFSSDITHPKIEFYKADLLEDLQTNSERFDTILCQRTIHYLPHSEAQRAVSLFYEALRPNGCLFLSASGMESELGMSYPGQIEDINQRFHRLSAEMGAKHGIEEPVCLYYQHEMDQLLKNGGFEVQRSWLSEFGNVKVVGRKVPLP